MKVAASQRGTASMTRNWHKDRLWITMGQTSENKGRLTVREQGTADRWRMSDRALKKRSGWLLEDKEWWTALQDEFLVSSVSSLTLLLSLWLSVSVPCQSRLVDTRVLAHRQRRQYFEKCFINSQESCQDRIRQKDNYWTFKNLGLIVAQPCKGIESWIYHQEIPCMAYSTVLFFVVWGTRASCLMIYVLTN